MKESTSQLIERLGMGLQPSPPLLLDRRLAAALGIGAVAAFVLLLAFLGCAKISQQLLQTGSCGGN